MNDNDLNEKINSEYYLLEMDCSYPPLGHTNPDYDLSRLLSRYKPVVLQDDYKMLELCTGIKIKNPEFVDYHALFGTEHVFSERLKQAIETLNPIKVQFLPAVIVTKEEVYRNYFVMNCYNVIPAMDKEKSEWTKSPNPMPGREVLDIDTLVLDAEKIIDIPLAQRLIFALGECPSFTLFHESVIDSLVPLKPKGFFAVALDAWDSDLLMDL